MSETRRMSHSRGMKLLRTPSASSATQSLPSLTPAHPPLASDAISLTSAPDSDHEHAHEHRDTHHDLPTIDKFPRPRAASRSAGQRPLNVTPQPQADPISRSNSLSSATRPSRSGSLTQRGVRKTPSIPSLPKIPQSAVPHTSPTPPAPADPTSPAFVPLSKTDSRMSARTFLEPAGLLTGYHELARTETLASKAGTVGQPSGLLPDDEKGQDGDMALGATEFTFPDGGLRAWLCVAGGGAALFCGFGLAPCAGIAQTYYQNTFLKEYSPSTVSWIGSAQCAIAFGPAAFTGSLFDLYGHRPLIAAGSFFLMLGYCLLSLCSKYYQIFLCQSVLIPIGMNLMFISPVGVITQWFQLKRGRAFALMMAGSGMGSTIWPIMWANLPQKIGFGWTMRLIGFMCGLLGCLAYFGLKTRLPPRPPGPFFYVDGFKDLTYVLVIIASACYVFALFCWFFFIGMYGQLLGLPIAHWLLIMLNGSSVVGRLATAIVADRIGAYNLCIMACAVMSVCFWAWQACKSTSSLIAINVTFGVFSGIFASLQAPMIVRLAPDIRLSGTCIGQVLLFQAIGQLIGPPIAGALLGHGPPEQQLANFKGCIALGAAMQTINVILTIWARLRIERRIFKAL